VHHLQVVGDRERRRHVRLFAERALELGDGAQRPGRDDALLLVRLDPDPDGGRAGEALPDRALGDHHRLVRPEPRAEGGVHLEPADPERDERHCAEAGDEHGARTRQHAVGDGVERRAEQAVLAFARRLAAAGRRQQHAHGRDERQLEHERAKDAGRGHEAEVAHRRDAEARERGEPGRGDRAGRDHHGPDARERHRDRRARVAELGEALVVALQDLHRVTRGDGEHEDRRERGPGREAHPEEARQPHAPDHREYRGRERQHDRLGRAEGLVVDERDHDEREPEEREDAPRRLLDRGERGGLPADEELGVLVALPRRERLEPLRGGLDRCILGEVREHERPAPVRRHQRADIHGMGGDCLAQRRELGRRLGHALDERRDPHGALLYAQRLRVRGREAENAPRDDARQRRHALRQSRDLREQRRVVDVALARADGDYGGEAGAELLAQALVDVHVGMPAGHEVPQVHAGAQIAQLEAEHRRNEGDAGDDEAGPRERRRDDPLHHGPRCISGRVCVSNACAPAVGAPSSGVAKRIFSRRSPNFRRPR
jgi:hypothetical protein